MAFVPPMAEEWESLYEVAGRFKELACWKWMSDTDMFGVCNPETGTIGYCSVLGRIEEVYGMIVFQGTEGLRLNLETMYPQIGGNPLAMACRQNFLSLSFCDRDDLWPQDLKIIKSLGLKYRGRNAWPQFRSYRPGFAPWLLEDWETRQFTVTLLLAIDIAKRVKEAPGILTGPDEDSFMVMVAKEEETSLVWQGEWVKPNEVEDPDGDYFPPADVPVDEERLKKIGESTQRVTTVWEVDFAPVPLMVMEADRPFFPFFLLVVEKEKQLVLLSHAASLREHPAEFTNELLGLIETLGFIPSTIQVCTEDCRGLFAPIADLLGIKLTRLKKLKSLEKARNKMLRELEKKE